MTIRLILYQTNRNHEISTCIQILKAYITPSQTRGGAAW